MMLDFWSINTHSHSRYLVRSVHIHLYFSTSPRSIMSSNLVDTITNNLDCSVDIYDVFDPNTNSDPGTSVALTYAKLATVIKGASSQKVQAIHPASQPQAMVTGNIEALNNNYY